MGIMERNEEIIDAYIARLGSGAPSETLERFFTRMIGDIWERASHTLSDLTLDAIFERALIISTERFPLLKSYELGQRQVVRRGLSWAHKAMSDEEMIQGFRHLLVTVFALIGNLTGTVLLSALYREIEAVPPIPVKGPEIMKAQETQAMPLQTTTVKNESDRISTHITNLDAILCGGLPKGSITIIAGPPGTGKTILSQQVCFPEASPSQRVIFFQTLSEPTAKTLKYVSHFKFYDPAKLEDGSIEFIDLGGIAKMKELHEGVEVIMEHVRRVKPALVVIDSFKVFEDLASSREDLRKFSYEVAINLMAWECTALLLGEFSTVEMEENPLFSIVDGLIRMKVRLESGEEQRFLQVVKMRGTDHSRDVHSLAITEKGLGVYAPRVTIRRTTEAVATGVAPVRVRLGISKMDELLGEGIPVGSSILISGVAGTGKTLLSLEFIYRGAKEFGEKGVYFSFEETNDRILAEATSMGWEMEALISSGLIRIVFIPQPEIIVEKHLLMMADIIQETGAKRIAIDSVSLFVHKLTDPQMVREKTYQLATLVQKAQAIGFFVTDIAYGNDKLSRFGVEETVVDGVFLLTSSENGYLRERFIEIYKLRNTSHLNGRNRMKITEVGISITPREKMILHQKKGAEPKGLTGKSDGKTSAAAEFRPKEVPSA